MIVLLHLFKTIYFAPIVPVELYLPKLHVLIINTTNVNKVRLFIVLVIFEVIQTHHGQIGEDKEYLLISHLLVWSVSRPKPPTILRPQNINTACLGFKCTVNK